MEYSVNSILKFAGKDAGAFWSAPLFRFYPDIDQAHYWALSDSQRKGFLTDYFSAYEAQHSHLISEKLAKYNEYWRQHEAQITAALQDAFQIDLAPLFNDLKCYATFNPISPRYLSLHTFDNCFLESEKGALGTAMHELIHFVWFYVWQQHFQDDPAEYETPHLKWILSEMAVEPIMRDERLGSINLYYQHKACVYPYFYTMKIAQKPVLDALYDLHRSLPVQAFMEAAYSFCLENEADIRHHIQKSEGR